MELSDVPKFTVKDIFYLRDGKTVFAGNFSSGEKIFGKYRLTVDGCQLATLDIDGEMQFPSKGTEDVALYTFTPLMKDSVNLSGKMELVYVDEPD